MSHLTATLMGFLLWPRTQIRRLYAWTVSWAQTKYADRALGGFAFMESSFFPIPPDPLLIAMTTVRPRSYLKFATICTVASVLGGVLGYIIGVGLYDAVGTRIVDFYGLHEEFVEVGRRYQDNAFLSVMIAGFTPIPYKVFTIAAGAFRIDILSFVIASLIGRGGRFFLVAFLMHHFGKRYQHKIERYVDVLSLLFVILLIAGFLAIRYVL